MERKKEWLSKDDPIGNFLYWRGMVAVCWVMLFFLFFFGSEAVFGSGSYLYSVILSSLIVAIGAVFVFRHLKKKEQKSEEKRKR